MKDDERINFETAWPYVHINRISRIMEELQSELKALSFWIDEDAVLLSIENEVNNILSKTDEVIDDILSKTRISLNNL